MECSSMCKLPFSVRHKRIKKKKLGDADGNPNKWTRQTQKNYLQR